MNATDIIRIAQPAHYVGEIVFLFGMFRVLKLVLDCNGCDVSMCPLLGGLSHTLLIIDCGAPVCLVGYHGFTMMDLLHLTPHLLTQPASSRQYLVRNKSQTSLHLS